MKYMFNVKKKKIIGGHNKIKIPLARTLKTRIILDKSKADKSMQGGIHMTTILQELRNKRSGGMNWR